MPLAPGRAGQIAGEGIHGLPTGDAAAQLLQLGCAQAAQRAAVVKEVLVAESDTASRLRGLYGFRRNRFASRFDENSDGDIEQQSLSYQRLRRELLDAERSAIVDLRRDGVISGDVERRLQRDLDLEDARLDI